MSAFESTSAKKLNKNIGKAIADHDLINHGDRILVAVSGGKDSMAMIHFFKHFQSKAPIDFDFFALTLDQGQPGFDSSELEKFYQNLVIEYYIEYKDTYSVVLDKIDEYKTYCSLCSRLRRGILYTKAREYNANKIALGHHADDAFETLFLNLFYSGRLAAMSPKYTAESGQEVIRPLIFCDEETIVEFSIEQNYPIIPCNLCGSQENLQRQRMKKLLAKEEKINPHLRSSLKSALRNVQDEFLWSKNKSKSLQHVPTE